MPITQLHLFDPDTQTAPAQDCADGCGCALTEDNTVPTPDGPMCGRCFNDLFFVCNDCGDATRLDDWGDHDTIRTGPDHIARCESCHNARFVTCVRCSRVVSREGRAARESPRNSAQLLCLECWEGRWFECSLCGEVSDRNSRYEGPDGTSLCPTCFMEDYVACIACGQAIEHGSASGPEDDPYCSGCMGRADTWKVQPWTGVATSYDRVGSRRCFGVEIETCECSDFRQLHGATEWGCVYECSTQGRELVSPILEGDEGFDAVANICDFANDHDWTVDSSCGLHIHLDARDLSSDQLLRVVYAYRKTYMLWKKFVTRSRSSNSMCGAPQYSCADVKAAEHFEDLAETSDRFEFLNLRAYICHGSIEIRLYHGSLNAREICNWVAIHTRFIDAVKDMSFDDIDAAFGHTVATVWRGIVNVIGDPKLLDYWLRKAAQRNNTLIAHWDQETPVPTTTMADNRNYA